MKTVNIFCLLAMSLAMQATAQDLANDGRLQNGMMDGGMMMGPGMIIACLVGLVVLVLALVALIKYLRK